VASPATFVQNPIGTALHIWSEAVIFLAALGYSFSNAPHPSAHHLIEETARFCTLGES